MAPLFKKWPYFLKCPGRVCKAEENKQKNKKTDQIRLKKDKRKNGSFPKVVQLRFPK